MVNRYASGAGLALVFIVSACGGVSDRSSGVRTYENPDRHEGQAAAPQTPERQVALAPRFTVTTIDDQTVTVPDGSSPTIVYFMATWCLPCLRATGELDTLHRDYVDRGLRVLAVDIGTYDRASDLAAFRDLFPDSRFLWALDDGRRVMRAYKVTSLDATVLVGPRGEILFRSEAYPNFSALRGAVQQAMGQ